jgi:hypothetical protein
MNSIAAIIIITIIIIIVVIIIIIIIIIITTTVVSAAKNVRHPLHHATGFADISMLFAYAQAETVYTFRQLCTGSFHNTLAGHDNRPITHAA